MDPVTPRAQSATAQAPVAKPSIRADTHPAGGWLHAPVRGKLLVLIMASTAGGLLAGAVETAMGERVWPLLVALGAVMTLAYRVGAGSIAVPLEEMAAEMERARRTRRPPRRRALPQDRGDEIGTLAEIAYELSTEAYRHHAAANHLRRELDRRVARSTRQATLELQQLAMRDPMTDLGNRRFLDAHLGSLVQSCRSSKTELVCVAMDLDGFKAVNDQLGHSSGDRLLVFLANLIRAGVRSEDLAIRLGGDEFIVLMPGCDAARAAHVVRRIMALLAQHTRVVLPAGVRVTLSCGIASMHHDQLATGDRLLELADTRLYHAKNAGKNRIIDA